MIKLQSLEDTKKFGYKLGKLLFNGSVLCLNGELGAGKTTLTKEIAKGLGIDDYVTSPTFNIVNEYYGDINLYHIDTYRLDDNLDVDYLGFDEYFDMGGVCIIEWADKISKILPKEYLEINILKNSEFRIIEIIAKGNKYEEIRSILYESFGD